MSDLTCVGIAAGSIVLSFIGLGIAIWFNKGNPFCIDVDEETPPADEPVEHMPEIEADSIRRCA